MLAKSKSISLAEVLSFLRAVCFIDPLICAYTAVCGAFSLGGSLFDSHGRWQHSCARAWSWLILKTGGVRLKVTGLENIPANTTVIFCSNHPSAMDIPILFVSLPVQFRFVAKRSLFNVPFLGWHLWRSGHIPIERERRYKAIRSLDQAAERIRAGCPVVLFPEGTRPRDDRLGAFKKGSFYLAIKSGAPVIPITINGSRAVLRPDSLHVRPGTVEVSVHPVIPTSEFTLTDVQRLSDQVRQTIQASFRWYDS
ncbi:MAG TPA: lysophospholipid acyltransferase family protein [Terriglobia bacterium]|nr:lysophospholipid acyltransferase family protein [Terriglobia bacterium]